MAVTHKNFPIVFYFFSWGEKYFHFSEKHFRHKPETGWDRLSVHFFVWDLLPNRVAPSQAPAKSNPSQGLTPPTSIASNVSSLKPEW